MSGRGGILRNSLTSKTWSFILWNNSKTYVSSISR
ncbi:hypothetical protein vBEcoMWL3_gp100 [Escherichia phage vB_EcoM_WL-3]|nr:hypothetical protein vBEcoMWL3_gp100 [Escherichia phage vB_EcoM_WL-3]